MRRWNTCRFCEAPMSDELVKYGTRHYAHFRCYLDAGKPLSDLSRHEVERFPYFLLKERGLLTEATALTSTQEGNMTTWPYAEDGKCHNANRGTFGHECGKPSTWVGTKATNGFRSGFCDHCKQHGDEARQFSLWTRR